LLASSKQTSYSQLSISLIAQSAALGEASVGSLGDALVVAARNELLLSRRA